MMNIFRNRYRNYVSAFIIFLLFIINGYSQNLTNPRVSPHAKVFQTIGLTNIEIDYHRPGVKGRVIWGALVPLDGTIWRAGANDNTTICFSTDVKVDGNDLKAGTYGLHMIPGKEEWIVIFNKVNTAWGSYFYDESEDALRIRVKPIESEMQEWLCYEFENLTPNSAKVFLHWEKLRIPFLVEVDLHKTIIDNYKKELVSLAGFSWQSYYQAASYCLQNNVELELAGKWIDKSIDINKNGANLHLKAQLLTIGGKEEESEKLLNEAVEIATEAELNQIGYQYLFSNEVIKSIEIFEINAKRHPNSWNVYDSLAEALVKNGEKDRAVENYEIALDKAPENQKERIRQSLNKLR